MQSNIIMESSQVVTLPKDYIDRDIPERLLKAFTGRITPNDEELNEEATWINEHIFTKNKPNNENILRILKAFRINHLDLPYLYTYQNNLYNTQVITIEQIWEIVRLDSEWTEFYRKKQNIITSIKNAIKQHVGKYQYILRYIQNAKNIYEIEDVEGMILYNEAKIISEYPSKERNIDANKDEVKKCSDLIRIKIDEFVNKFCLLLNEIGRASCRERGSSPG